MFKNVIIDTELLPLRKAASQGDLAAMCQLARHIIDGDRTQLSTDIVEELCIKISEHKDIEGDIEAIRNLCKLLADWYWMRHEEGKISSTEAREEMRLSLKNLIFWTVQKPMEEWDIEELKNCTEWLYLDETEPLESIH